MKKEELVEYWVKNKIIKDERVIKAFKKVKRENFILNKFLDEAYEDHPLSIGFEQTISQPTTIMIMTEALEVKEGDNILEIGTGSGYQAAILSILTGEKGKIYTTEIIPKLANFAKKNLREFKNVKVIETDGSKGYKKYMPYQRIIVTAACPRLPEELIKQLDNNGILVAPVGSLHNQELLKIRKKDNKLEIKNLGDFIFVPLKGEFGY